MRVSGVRARVQVSFALGGLLLSVFLAAISWNLTSTYLYNQREITATRSALVSADLLQRRVAQRPRPTQTELQQSTSIGNDALYLPPPDVGGAVAASAAVGVRDVPDELLARAAAGVAVQQRIVVDGRPLLAVALPMPSDGAVYVELVSLRELDQTLRGLSLILAGTAALAAAMSAALGRWAAQRSLQPLWRLVSAAAAVADGKLSTRIEADRDRDLMPLARAFNTTVASLQARVERDARFASDVSHELRSPVTTIANAGELLQNRKQELSPEGQEALELLQSEIGRFRTLVEDLLEVSRDDQKHEAHLTPLRLAPLVRKVADEHAGRPVTQVAADADEVVVDGDARRLERVVANLVENARLHGGDVADVTVERCGETARITVRDVGDGVPEADRERVFERFYRGSSSRPSRPGSGLGLAIVQQHVRVHGGTVTMQATEPRGTAVVVVLPVSEGPP